MGRLEWLDQKRSSQPSHKLDEEYRLTWREYEKVLAQEDIMWFQKSCARWLQFGVRNTRYFHGVTAIRRRKNTYDMLQDDSGEWINNVEQL